MGAEFIARIFTDHVDSGQSTSRLRYYSARNDAPIFRIPASAATQTNMPNTASAKKRLRQNAKRRLHNRSLKSRVRSQIRRVREAVAAGDAEKAQAEFRVASKRLDQAASKNLIHKNAAARSKSRLSKLVKATSGK